MALLRTHTVRGLRPRERVPETFVVQAADISPAVSTAARPSHSLRVEIQAEWCVASRNVVPAVLGFTR